MEIELASITALPPGKMLGIEKDGKSILLANVDGEYYAIGNICTHLSCKLSYGTLSGNRVRCTCHGSTFDVRTGAVVAGPATYPEPSFKLKVENGKIFLA